MYNRIDNLLRAFRIAKDAPIPFILGKQIPLQFIPCDDYFMFHFRQVPIVTRYSCLQSYLEDNQQSKLTADFKNLVLNQGQTSDSLLLLEKLQLSRDQQVYLPNLSTILQQLKKDEHTFRYLLRSNFGSLQFSFSFKCNNLLLDNNDQTSQYCNFQPQRGIEWTVTTIKNVFIVSSQLCTSVTICD